MKHFPRWIHFNRSPAVTGLNGVCGSSLPGAGMAFAGGPLAIPLLRPPIGALAPSWRSKAPGSLGCSRSAALPPEADGARRSSPNLKGVQPSPRPVALRAPALREGWRMPRNPGSTDDRRRRSIKCHVKYWEVCSTCEMFHAKPATTLHLLQPS